MRRWVGGLAAAMALVVVGAGQVQAVTDPYEPDPTPVRNHGNGTALPGQPYGIPVQAQSYQWRLDTGNVCIRDWTNGFWADGLQHAAAEYSASSDLNVSYRTGYGCEAAGFPDTQIITAVVNPEPCTDAIGQAHVWTWGGYLVEGYTIQRAVLHIFPACYQEFTSGPNPLTAAQIAEQKRFLAVHEAGHVFGFLHQEFPLCPRYWETNPDDWWTCRPDTGMHDPGLHGHLSGWDYWRLDVIYPW